MTTTHSSLESFKFLHSLILFVHGQKSCSPRNHGWHTHTGLFERYGRNVEWYAETLFLRWQHLKKCSYLILIRLNLAYISCLFLPFLLWPERRKSPHTPVNPNAFNHATRICFKITVRRGPDTEIHELWFVYNPAAVTFNWTLDFLSRKLCNY